MELRIDAPEQTKTPGIVVERGRLAIHLGTGATFTVFVHGQQVGGCDIPAP